MSKSEREFYEYQARYFAEHAPLVEQSSAVEVVLMESWLDDEIRCEVHHPQNDCAIEVTHRIIFCAGSGLMCDTATAVNERRIARDGFCSHCRRHAAVCWRIETA